MVTQNEAKDEAAILYRTKVVQFLGRSVPIILQNDNGPCPLLAICNVLLLRNNINLNMDMTEISLQRLLSLVAERLLDANSNTENKNEEYVCNQQQNIADAIELLPRLATGLDVNVRFRNTHDFEFTPECAVFDLLDIGLVHGWLYDPQDEMTSKTIGSNSYNSLVEKLVELQTKRTQGGQAAELSEDDFVDFAAATTAVLGVPSPSLEILSRTRSMEDIEIRKQFEKSGRKGDEEEAARLQVALELSKGEAFSATNPLHQAGYCDSEEKICLGDTYSELEVPNLLESSSIDVDIVAVNEIKHLIVPQASDSMKTSHVLNSSSDDPGRENISETSGISQQNAVELKGVDKSDSPRHGETVDQTINPLIFSNSMAVSTEQLDFKYLQITDNGLPLNDILVAKEACNCDEPSSLSCSFQMCDEELIPYPSECESEPLGSGTPLFPKNSVVTGEEIRLALMERESGDMAIASDRAALSQETEDISYDNEIDDAGSSSLQSSEPLYEGEAILIEAETYAFEGREPLYEGEVILTEHPDARDMIENVSSLRSSDRDLKSEVQEEHLLAAMTEGIVIETFLNNNASQLTYYGLFSLQEELKERELCVFFRNNHFNSMFKYNGDLYLLVTDQGYLNQPDIVWEKLHEVHGDSVFFTGNFSVFQADQNNNIWNEQDAVAATADYLSSQKSNEAGSQQDVNDINYQSDLQLAMALQQQEFEERKWQQHQREQQHQQQAQQQSHPSSLKLRAPGRTEAGRLVTGPKSSSIPPKQETKAKDKCVIM